MNRRVLPKWVVLVVVLTALASLSVGTAGASDKVELMFWYSLGGAASTAVQDLVAKFNESQDRYAMTAEYQGTYDDSLLKFTSSRDGQRPDVIHINEIGTATLLDLGAYVPVQQFIDRGDLDTSDYMTKVLDAYKYDGEMYAFPFSITVPGIFYNEEAFDAAGVDPSTLHTFEGFVEASEQLAASGVTTYGASIVADTWIYEQLMASMNVGVVDNENGRGGRATQIVADENGGLHTVLSAIRDFNASPATFVSSDFADVRRTFANGEIGMYVETVGTFSVTSEIVDGRFTIRQRPLFRLDGYEDGHPYPSGAALWVVDRGDEEKALGVVEFIKFFMEQENQVEFALATGYLPIREDVIDDPRYEQYVAEVNPGTWDIVQDLMDSTWPGSALFGSLGEFRRIVNNQVVAMHDDASFTVDQAVERIAEEANEQIWLYNLSN